MFKLQPEEIQYLVSSTSPDTIAPEDDDEEEGLNRNTIIIGEYTYQNIPFTLNRNNKQITALSINISDIVENMKKEIGKSKFHDVQLHYYHMKKTDIPLVGTRIDVEITNPLEVSHGEINLHTTPFKKYAVRGNFAVKEISYEETIKDDIFDVKITLTQVTQLDEDGVLVPEEEVTEETILSLLNPIDTEIPVSLLLNGELIFEGRLVDITTSSAKAMGKEIELAEKTIKKAYYSGQPYLIMENGGLKWSNVTTIEDMLDLFMRPAANVPYVKMFDIVYGDMNAYNKFHTQHFESLSFVGTTIWDTLVQVANSYGYFLAVKGNNIYLKTEDRNLVNKSMTISGTIPESFIEDRELTFRGYTTYNGIEISGNFSGLVSNWGTQTYRIKCYNKSLIAGEGIDYETNKMIDTEDAVSDSTSFHFVHNALDGMSVSVSDGKIGYIETTLPEDKDYASSITISVRPDLLPCVRRLGTDQEGELTELWEWNQGNVTIPKQQPEGLDVEFVIKNVHGKEMNPGEIVIDIFGDYDSLEYFEIDIPIKTPEKLTLIDGYYEHIKEVRDKDNLVSHSANLMQGVNDTTLEIMQDYILTKENQKLVNIRLQLNNYFDTKPSDILNYEYQNDFPHIVVENVQTSFDKKREMKTTIEGFSYVWPI